MAFSTAFNCLSSSSLRSALDFFSFSRFLSFFTLSLSLSLLPFSECLSALSLDLDEPPSLLDFFSPDSSIPSFSKTFFDFETDIEDLRVSLICLGGGAAAAGGEEEGRGGCVSPPVLSLDLLEEGDGDDPDLLLSGPGDLEAAAATGLTRLGGDRDLSRFPRGRLTRTGDGDLDREEDCRRRKFRWPLTGLFLLGLVLGSDEEEVLKAEFRSGHKLIFFRSIFVKTYWFARKAS